MFIAIDIGNTHTVIGIYQKEIFLCEWRIPSTIQLTKDEIGARLKFLLTKAAIKAKKIDGIGISSVVPHLTDVYAATAHKYFHQEPMIVSTALDLGITIHYDNPKSLGADRICNAVAGFEKYGGPLIIIDFGTATTYDVIASNGDYLGGVIASGIETSVTALHQRAAKLPKVKLRLPETVIGIDTMSSMQAGILWGAVDSMTGMVKRIQKEIRQREKKNAVVIATGGFSKFISDHSKIIQHVETSLVLDGIRLIYKRVNRNGKNRK